MSARAPFSRTRFATVGLLLGATLALGLAAGIHYGRLGNHVKVIAISTGDEHTCALISNHTVKCWGRNSDGQLGDDTATDSPIPVKVKDPNDSSGYLTGVVAISVGGNTCALLTDHTIKCWGDNAGGMLGDGLSHTDSLGHDYSPTPVKVKDPNDLSGYLTGVVAISVGENHICVLISNHTVKCWGSNYHGQLGDGTTTERSTPVQVGGITSAIQISAGAGHTCALLADHTIKCWGWNRDGQLGDGVTNHNHQDELGSDISPTPVAVLSGGIERRRLMNATWITVGWGHTCARISGGTVDCWGQNVYGSLGQGTIGGSSNTPVHVKDPSDNSGHLTGVATISAGQSQTCALLSGTVKCWGLNHHGQLGDSTTTIRPTPVQVGGNLTGVAAISAGGDETCAFLSGTVKCWGFNIWGELGIGYATTTSPYGIPAPVSVIDLP